VDIDAKILNVLKDSSEPLKGKEIAEAAVVDKKDVDKAIKRLKKEEKIFSPKNCYYSAK